MHILLVEDNSADADLMIDLLRERRNMLDVHWVRDGRDALEHVRNRDLSKAVRPDLILLDLGLPRISGYDVLQQLKEDPNYARIPVVILTTSTSALDKTQCRALGADYFISKPHSLQGYEKMIDELLAVDLPRLVNAYH